jgi:N6-L-threonylcarbamoyladenine synthase
LTEQRTADIASAFQEAVVDVLVAKCAQAVEQFGHGRLLVGGGVAANRRLRVRLEGLASDRGLELIIPPLHYCTDNAAMSAIAWELLERGEIANLDLDVTAGLVRRARM